MTENDVVVPEKVLALIEKGQNEVQAREQEAERRYKALQAELRAGWDELNDNVRAVLPEILRPYMVDMARAGHGPGLDSPPSLKTGHSGHVHVEIPGLAPIRTGYSYHSDRGWKHETLGGSNRIGLYILPAIEQSEYDYDYYYSFKHSYRGTEDLNEALVLARNRYLEMEGRKQSVVCKAAEEPEYVDADVTRFASLEEAMRDTMREIVNELMRA